MAKNVSYTGGFIGMLASLAVRAIPLAACVLPTILSGLQLVYFLVVLTKRLVAVVLLEMDSYLHKQDTYLPKQDKCKEVYRNVKVMVSI